MKVLVVDDERDIREVLEGLFEDAFPEVERVLAGDGLEALGLIRQGGIDLVVTDLLMPHLGGEGLLAALKVERPDLPVIITSAHGTIERAVALLHAGARDFITKPFVTDDLVHRVGLALETVRLQGELTAARQALAEERLGGRLLHASGAMRAVLDRARLAARTSAPVLITGESGTGKELLARELHQLGHRRDRPFVAVNCGAFTETLLEAELFGHEKGAFTGADRVSPGVIKQADGGTLFLDEVGETSPSFQVKLLRFLQEGEIRPVGRGLPDSVDTRVIAATNQDLRRLMERDRFREDLFYRLNVIPIHLPPLRERPEDILLLAHQFLKTWGQEVGRELHLAPAAAQRLLDHPWPGNVRELENKIRQLAVLAPTDRIEAEHLDLAASPGRPPALLPWPVVPGLSFRDAKQAAVDRFERVYLEGLLRRHRGVASHAAEEAGLDRKNLWRLMKRHGIEADRYRG